MREIVSGIYKIVNIINNNYYVGSSYDILSTSRRKYNHINLLRRNKHYNKHLQHAWNKYGEENFNFIIIERDINKNQLLIVEQKYLDIAKLEKKKCYNKSFIAGKVEMTKETRDKIGKSKIGNKYMLGKHHTNETKEKISKTHKGKIISIITREKISKTLKKIRHSPKTKGSGENNPSHDIVIYTFFNKKTKEIYVGKRCNFYKKFNFSRISIHMLVSGRAKSMYGWVILNPVIKYIRNL